MKPCTLVATSLLAAVLAAPALAVEVYTTSLAGETPGTSPGTGSARVTIDLDLLTMRVEAAFNGLSAPTTASHIHCCTVAPGVGNAGVATGVPTFADFPLGVTAGSYDRTFDMTMAGLALLGLAARRRRG